MIQPVQQSAGTPPATVPYQNPNVCIHPTTLSGRVKVPPTFFSWLFAPVVALFNWLLYPFIPSFEELEMIDILLDDAARIGVLYLKDQHEAKRQLSQRLIEVEKLSAGMESKWLRNIAGLKLLRANLLKLQIRFLAALGREEEIPSCERKLHQIGYVLPDQVLAQIATLKKLNDRPARYLLTVLNGLVKIAQKMRGRRDSNSQLPP